MDKNRQNEYLGVNKMGKNIRKSPIHQPNFISSSNGNTPARQQPQPQVYNISKNDFRSIVQQLTGSPSNEALPRPPNNPPKPASMRLQRIRPPPLTPIKRPPLAPMVPAQVPVPPQAQDMAMAPAQVPYNNNFVRPPQFGHPPSTAMPPAMPADSTWMNPALSPLSAYMQQLQSCINDAGPRPIQVPPDSLLPPPSQAQVQHQFQSQIPGQVQGQVPSSGLLPFPSMPPMLSPRMTSPAFLPSPSSLPSPSVFLNLLSPTPRSPYPLFSPGSQFPPPLSPNFSFMPMSQSGLLVPGPQPPLSPGIGFPLSPSGFFPISSPRWRAQ
ncbi:hypothetical protein Ancab_033000 [Ancistrocladus abbreviatus]